LVPTPTPRGQPLTWTVTIGDAMSFCMLFSRDMDINLMSLQLFLTLQIPISGLTQTPPVQGPSSDIMETQGSVVVPVTLGVAKDFQTFLVNFFIVDPMLPYEAILTWGESQDAMVSASPHQRSAPTSALRSPTSVFC
jgi:hypothetical protein